MGPLVGDQECSFLDVVKVLRDSKSFHIILTKLFEIARNLSVPDDQVHGIRAGVNAQILTYQGALWEILVGWRAKMSDQATLGVLVEVLRNCDVREAADNLEKHFKVKRICTATYSCPPEGMANFLKSEQKVLVISSMDKHVTAMKLMDTDMSIHMYDLNDFAVKLMTGELNHAMDANTLRPTILCAKIQSECRQLMVEIAEAIQNCQPAIFSSEDEKVEVMAYFLDHLRQELGKLNPEEPATVRTPPIFLSLAALLKKKNKVHVVNYMKSWNRKERSKADPYDYNRWMDKFYESYLLPGNIRPSSNLHRGGFNTVHASQSTQIHFGGDAASNVLERAYILMGLSKSATDTEVNRAYRQLSRENHPDKVASREIPPSEDEIKRAVDKFIKVQKAVALIKTSRNVERANEGIDQSRPLKERFQQFYHNLISFRRESMDKTNKEMEAIAFREGFPPLEIFDDGVDFDAPLRVIQNHTRDMWNQYYNSHVQKAEFSSTHDWHSYMI